MRRQLALALLLAAATAPTAFADGLPDGRGVAAPRGSEFRSIISPAGDADDYVFLGLHGMDVSAVVAVTRVSTLAPVLEFVRPDGTVVAEDDGVLLRTRARTVSAKFTLDASGTWKVRVRGSDDGPTGDYSVALTTPKRVRSFEASMRDTNGQYRFLQFARGGATLRWHVTTDEPLITLNSFRDPRGNAIDVPGSGPTREVRIPDGLPAGVYAVTFDAPSTYEMIDVMFTSVPAKEKRRKGRLSGIEPAIVNDGITPTSGGVGSLITVETLSMEDPLAPRDGVVGLFLDDIPLENVQLLGDHSTVTGVIPEGTPTGTYDVVVTSTSGQPAVRADAFEVVPPPTLVAFDPGFGSVLGGQVLTLTGRDFRTPMGLLIDGVLQPVTATYADSTTLRFPLPTHAIGFVTLGVIDLGSQLTSQATETEFEFVTTPVITRISPELVPILGGDTVTLEGLLFAPDDHVFLETTTPGTYEELTVTQQTYVDGTRHRFVTPVRPKGDYGVHVIDALGRPNPPKTRTLTYFDFADVTASTGFGTTLADAGDAVTSALLDVDGDGDLDLVLARSGGETAAATPQTRVFRNDGHGVFSDATAAVIPAAGTDDWRADRIVAADLDDDGRTDLVLTTNSLTVPPSNRSHTRLMMNERRGGIGSDADDRVLRDRTTDLMAPVRTMGNIWSGSYYVSDDWRGLDLWVGDLDGNGSGPPDIVLTHDEVKDDPPGVNCGNYCASPYSNGYSYAFYWGGSRTFVWDKNARQGLGRYKFDANWFPRKAAVSVWIFGAPDGVNIPFCNAAYGKTCKGSFTPFAGKRLAVGDLNADGKQDVAVVADHAVQRRFSTSGSLSTISSLQVAVQGFNAQDGAKVTDVTATLTALGADLAGDAVAIGQPDGGPYGTIALGRSAAPLRLLRWFDAAGTLSVGDVSAATLPAPVGADTLQAGEIRFVDVDRDGDLDLVLLASAAPGGTQVALRVLLNDESGVFVRRYDQLVDAAVLPGDTFEGAALSIGDVSGDGLPEFAVSRTPPGEQSAETRFLSIQK